MEKVKAIEWPTICLAILIYGGWMALTFYHAQLPTAAVVIAGAWLIAWQSSLQHECLHGHPTPWRNVNAFVAYPPLSLWLPFQVYRNTHLAHHRAEVLTDPAEDPESYYWTGEDWENLGTVGRFFVRAQTVLMGRLVLGPAWNTGRLIARTLTSLLKGEWRDEDFINWGTHCLACAVLLVWIAGICKMSLWFYLLAIVYPGTSLSLVRSFVEHRRALIAGERTAIVENARIFGLLFLFNNLHIIHHRRPDLPWYRIPATYREHRENLISSEATRVYQGYFEIARRYLVKPFDVPLHRLAP